MWVSCLRCSACEMPLTPVFFSHVRALVSSAKFGRYVSQQNAGCHVRLDGDASRSFLGYHNWLTKSHSPILTECNHDDAFQIYNGHQPKWTYLLALMGLFIIRYTWFIVKIVAYRQYKPTTLPENPSFSTFDVTLTVTTVDSYQHSFLQILSQILANKPARVIVALARDDVDWEPLANDKFISGAF